MKNKKFLLVALLLFGLSCNFLTRSFQLATPTPLASPTLVASSTPVVSSTPLPSLPATFTVTPLATPLSAGLYIPAECQGQPLATLAPQLSVVEPTPSPEPNPTLTKEEQLRVFDELTSIIKRVYLYPDYNGIDWPGQAAQTRARLKAGLDTNSFYAEMDQLVQALGDEHSQFQSPSQVAQENAELRGQNDFVGIGIMAEAMVEKKRIAIQSVFPDSPAEHAGLKVHDAILAVDGLPVVENDQALIWRVRGTQCSAAVLTIQTPGQEPRQVLLIRNRITSSVPVTAQLVKTKDGARIGYISLPSFFDETIPGQVLKALRKFGQLDGLIIDNRQNGGGSSGVVEPILSFFADGNLGSYVTRTSHTEFTIDANPVNNSQEVPLVVLVGESTASFGEIFSGILQDVGRAKIAGQLTLGNVEVLNSYSFADGSRAWIAEERFAPPVSHADWEKDGIRPDLVAYADWDTFTFENDPGIAAALQLLGHQ